MWKNKHVIIALLVAPVLALIAYFAVDATVSEKPHVAEEGAVYPLRVMSNCRYASGECELRNGDVRVRLALKDDATWTLDSEVALRGALIAAEHFGEPVPMTRADEDGLSWTLATSALPVDANRPIRLVVAVERSQYFAEFPATFVAQAR